MSKRKESELGFIPSHWKILKVNDLVNQNILEKPLDGNHGNIHPKSSDFVELGIPFIMASDIKQSKVDTTNCKFISEHQARNLQKGFAFEGDVLLTHKATLGRSAIVGSIPTPFIMLTPQVTYYRIKDTNLLNNIFLKYYFDSPSFQAILENYGSSGSTRSYIGITAQLELPILLPPPNEQQAIASVLSSLDDKIDLLHRQNKTLETMAETLFRQWFVEEVKDEWEEKKLDDILTVSSSKRIYYREYVPTGIPFYRSKEIIELNQKGSTSSDLFISEGRFNEINLKYGAPQEGDILLTSVGTLGIPYKVKKNDKFYFKDGNLTWFKDFKVLSSNIIYCWLNSSTGKEELYNITIGSTQSALTLSGLRQIKIRIPPQVICRKLNNELDIIYQKKDLNQTQIQTLTNLRALLIPKLMSGEVRVEIN